MKRPVITRLILFCEEPEYFGSSYFYGTVDYNVKNLKITILPYISIFTLTK